MNFNDLNILAMWTPGFLELTIILIIAVLIFGRRLPEIARGIGKSLTEFKKGVKEAKNVKDDFKNEVEEAVALDELKNENL